MNTMAGKVFNITDITNNIICFIDGYDLGRLRRVNNICNEVSNIKLNERLKQVLNIDYIDMDTEEEKLRNEWIFKYGHYKIYGLPPLVKMDTNKYIGYDAIYKTFNERKLNKYVELYSKNRKIKKFMKVIDNDAKKHGLEIKYYYGINEKNIKFDNADIIDYSEGYGFNVINRMLNIVINATIAPNKYNKYSKYYNYEEFLNFKTHIRSKTRGRPELLFIKYTFSTIKYKHKYKHCIYDDIIKSNRIEYLYMADKHTKIYFISNTINVRCDLCGGWVANKSNYYNRYGILNGITTDITPDIVEKLENAGKIETLEDIINSGYGEEHIKEIIENRKNGEYWTRYNICDTCDTFYENQDYNNINFSYGVFTCDSYNREK